MEAKLDMFDGQIDSCHKIVLVKKMKRKANSVEPMRSRREHDGGLLVGISPMDGHHNQNQQQQSSSSSSCFQTNFGFQNLFDDKIFNQRLNDDDVLAHYTHQNTVDTVENGGLVKLTNTSSNWTSNATDQKDVVVVVDDSQLLFGGLEDNNRYSKTQGGFSETVFDSSNLGDGLAQGARAISPTQSEGLERRQSLRAESSLQRDHQVLRPMSNSDVRSATRAQWGSDFPGGVVYENGNYQFGSTIGGIPAAVCNLETSADKTNNNNNMWPSINQTFATDQQNNNQWQTDVSYLSSMDYDSAKNDYDSSKSMLGTLDQQ